MEVIIAPRVSAGGSNSSSEVASSAASSAPATVSTTSTVALAASTLPSAVDNSKLAAFPPVRSQDDIGSCASFSSVYYMSTFAIAQARGLDVRNSGNADKLSPKFVYNLVNGGGDNGSWFDSVFEVMLKHGAPTWSDFPYSGVNTPSSYLDWPVASATWRGAISNRMASSYQLTALDTPGHAANHVSFALAGEAALFSGDHVMAWSTSIVAPPDGSMGDYMRSLQKLLGRSETVYWPGHGNAVIDPQRFVRGLLQHRRQREASVLDRLKAGDRTIPEIVTRVYTKLAPGLKPAAALSVFAQLEDMVERGLVLCEGSPALYGTYWPNQN